MVEGALSLVYLGLLFWWLFLIQFVSLSIKKKKKKKISIRGNLLSWYGSIVGGKGRRLGGLFLCACFGCYQRKEIESLLKV